MDIGTVRPDRPSRRPGPDTSEHRKHDFLTGVGPSSQEMYYAEEKKAFKPGWKSLQPQPHAQPQSAERALREAQQQGCAAARAQQLHSLNNYNQFNPITGQSRDAAGQWTAATDPWQHQRLGLKQVPPPASTADRRQAAEIVRAAGIGQMRQERIQNDGIVGSRPGGSVREIMQWQ